MVFTFLPTYLLPLPAWAQGLPLIRNYTATEYDAHNLNYDIEIVEDGTIKFVANFEGISIMTGLKWRIIFTHQTSNRATVVYRDSKNTIWAGGYNFVVAACRNGPMANCSYSRSTSRDSLRARCWKSSRTKAYCSLW